MAGDFFRCVDEYLAFRAETCRGFVKHAWLAAGKPGTLVLKNPELSLHLASLIEIWPGCRIVGCARDPRDQIASEFDVHERRLAMGEPAARVLDAGALARAPRSARTTASRWRTSASAATRSGCPPPMYAGSRRSPNR